MSHTVTVRTTTTTTSAVVVNTGHIKTWTGLLKFLETIVGGVILGLISYYGTHAPGGKRVAGFAGVSEEVLMLLVSFGCLLVTFLLLVSALFSLMSSSILPKTLFELLYHVFAFIFYLSAGLALIIYLSKFKDYHSYKPYGYEGKMAAAVLGLINAGLYVISTFFSFRSYRLG